MNKYDEFLIMGAKKIFCQKSFQFFGIYFHTNATSSVTEFIKILVCSSLLT